MKVSTKVRPEIYRLFRHIPNTPYNAMCEFIDNSIQAYLNSEIKETLLVNITITESEIVVEDNGPGFAEEDFSTAFEPARIPTNSKELNEFGMGMKLAALYFGDNYSVETSYDSLNTLAVEFNLPKVIKAGLEELDVQVKPNPKKESFTRIKVSELASHNTSPTLALPKYLAFFGKVYKRFIRDYNVSINVNGSSVKPLELDILYAPWYMNQEGESKHWYVDFNIKEGEKGINGRLGLLSKMSELHSGAIVYRRGRAISGITEQYKPKKLFSSQGSHLWKRLFAEINLEGFESSFNKSDVVDKAGLDTLIEKLVEQIKQESENILKMGAEYRVTKPKGPTPTPTPPQPPAPSPKPPGTPPAPKSRHTIISIGDRVFDVKEGKQTGSLIQRTKEPSLIEVRSDFFDKSEKQNQIKSLVNVFVKWNENFDATASNVANIINDLWVSLT